MESKIINSERTGKEKEEKKKRESKSISAINSQHDSIFLRASKEVQSNKVKRKKMETT